MCVHVDANVCVYYVQYVMPLMSRDNAGGRAESVQYTISPAEGNNATTMIVKCFGQGFCACIVC